MENLDNILCLPGQPRVVLVPDPSLVGKGKAYEYIRGIYDTPGDCQFNRSNSESEK